MARGPLLFRQRDVTAAVKGVLQAGLTVYRVEIGKDGRIIVISDLVPPVANETAPDPEPNPWDRMVEDALKGKVRQ
jgi:hypothetical protein